MVREFQSVIGEEASEQFTARIDSLPGACVACVGGWSNAMGLFVEFRDHPVDFYGDKGGGECSDSTRHAAPLTAGTEEVIHGPRTRVIDDVDGQRLRRPRLPRRRAGPRHVPGGRPM